MDHLQPQAPLGHHIGGHRGVDPPRQQAHRPPADAYGQSARAGIGVGVDVGGKVTHLQIDGDLRVVYVYLQVGEGILEVAAHRLGQLDGGHRKGLVRALGLHLEGLGGIELVCQIGLGGVPHGLYRLFAGVAAGQPHHAKEVLHGGVGSVHVAGLVQGLHIDGGLAGVDVELPEGLEPPPRVVHQLFLKAAAVGSLEDDLAQFQQDGFFHDVYLFLHDTMEWAGLGSTATAARRVRPTSRQDSPGTPRSIPR